jgi:hypothetical protein
MARFAMLAMVSGACSYTAPSEVGPTPDTPIVEPDSSTPDTPIVEPDGPAPDGPPPLPTTTDHVASADTYLDSVSPTTSFATTNFLLADGSPLRVALIRFDLSGLPPATQVVSSELHVFTTTDEGDQVVVFPLLEGWSEGTATWNQASTGVAWSAAGAAPPARGTTAVSTFTPNLESTEFASAFDAATVQGWISQPETNFGIAITSANADGPHFFTSEAAQFRPFLRITHIP